MNRSHSLPFKLFVIERGQKDVKVGDYVAFEPKPSAVGGYRLTFIKEVVNRSHSLPFKLFVIERGQKDVKVGDYVAFEPKPSAVGGYRLTFIKEVVCGPGQTLTRENRTFYCDGKELTTAKKRALNGNPLADS